MTLLSAGEVPGVRLDTCDRPAHSSTLFVTSLKVSLIHNFGTRTRTYALRDIERNPWLNGHGTSNISGGPSARFGWKFGKM